MAGQRHFGTFAHPGLPKDPAENLLVYPAHWALLAKANAVPRAVGRGAGVLYQYKSLMGIKGNVVILS